VAVGIALADRSSRSTSVAETLLVHGFCPWARNEVRRKVFPTVSAARSAFEKLNRYRLAFLDRQQPAEFIRSFPVDDVEKRILQLGRDRTAFAFAHLYAIH
jgi:hypothetical protein